MNKLLQMENLERHYETPAGVVKALDGVTFEIYEGERVILLGPSGSGKTTLLNCLSALDSPTGGEYTFTSAKMEEMDQVPRNNSEKMTSFRRENIGYVFQFFNLLQDLTVLENILLIQELAGKKDPARAKELLKLVGLQSEINRFPGEISGGQQQRVAIIRSLAVNPRLLLLDEVTSALDPVLVNEVLSAVRDLKSDGMTMVLATHEMGFATQVADEVCFLESGLILERGSPEEVLKSPQNAKTKDFLKRVHEAGRL